MKIYFSTDFFAQVTRLIKKAKDGYRSCLEDVISTIGNSNIQNILDTNAIIYRNGPLNVLKIRLPNTFKNLSKRDGYRLIAVVNTDVETITLLYIYPKKGKYCQDNISKQHIAKLLGNYINQADAKTIKSFNSDLSRFSDHFKK